MVRPADFRYNPLTATSNAFQSAGDDPGNVQQRALSEFDRMVEILRSNQLEITVINDLEASNTPDSIFPNNWISFHNGLVFLYPMEAENRRGERRKEVIGTLSHIAAVSRIEDLSYFEQQSKFLEGTGSMVLDRVNKLAYACLSPRTHRDVLTAFCEIAGYTPIVFRAMGDTGTPIYHTNVMMCIGEQFAVVCLESIADVTEREMVSNSLGRTGKELVAISYDQVNRFAGNMLELKNMNGEHILFMSESAYRSLTTAQVAVLEKYARLCWCSLSTIERNGGGSARCMIAEIF
ncbi:amidinotransferase [Pedobacter sp. HMF7056]|uniref:Amidinotransferase n=2 Tax=Hufsiella ginkgonis TaxID=2695274 RepID=A0A7K1Y011_9SPHI|nr:amidinotransferase [Hufsiella ginkgonis]